MTCTQIIRFQVQVLMTPAQNKCLVTDCWRNFAACECQSLIMPWPHSTKLSMCSKSSSHVMTPGVESGATKPGHCAHCGYAPTSLHMSSQIPASLFCTCERKFKSADKHPFSVLKEMAM